MRALEILVLEHERQVPAALFGDWAQARGHMLRTVCAAELTRWPDPRTLDVVVSLGSDRSIAASRESWIADEIEFLRSAHASQVPVLGICFGAQALASALGGVVSHAPQLALDWTTIDTYDSALISPGPWMRWHEDILSVPPEARELARAGSVPLAFVRGSSVGVQFHPEVDAELAHAWIEDSQRRLRERAVDLAALRRQVALAAPGAPARAHGSSIASPASGASQPIRR